MRTVFLLFDSLNRHMLGCYGGTKVPTPNFDRLAERTQVFERHYAGSLPCMPARRDMMTGRLSFLHRSWGPLEPFDNAVPEILAKAGVHSHLSTDHFHYWEDGGATYHTRYSTFDLVRGQQSDPWIGLADPPMNELCKRFDARQLKTSKHLHYAVNRPEIRKEADFPAHKVFTAGIDFIERNRESDDWFVQIETFDPHEPFFAPERFKQAFPTDWTGPILDWPSYDRVRESPEEAAELRANYYASLAFCDAQIGRVLDIFDAHELWQDTALVVTTDHGFLLGEHEYWAKNRMTLYEEIAHLPLFLHDPRAPSTSRCDTLTQSVDLAATFLHLHDMDRPYEMRGQPLTVEIKREGLIYGLFGGAVNLVSGNHSYHRYPPQSDAGDLFQYTLMPTHMAERFTPDPVYSSKSMGAGCVRLKAP